MWRLCVARAVLAEPCEQDWSNGCQKRLPSGIGQSPSQGEDTCVSTDATRASHDRAEAERYGAAPPLPPGVLSRTPQGAGPSIVDRAGGQRETDREVVGSVRSHGDSSAPGAR